MIIRDMFANDINRSINGVIKVNQDDSNIIDQEVSEYVITRELKGYFTKFFDSYSESFSTPTDNIGVWISGFFGSGKSHFLKMLSYILENKPVCGTTTVEKFREKFADDPLSFSGIDRSTKEKAETILFNIDTEGSVNKTNTAVLQVFAKMFYNHLGYNGQDLKMVKLEQFIQQKGKTDEFRKAYEEEVGGAWEEQKNFFWFNDDAVIKTLMNVIGMSEDNARHWFYDDTPVELSISSLVQDIKKYVDKKPDNYRLIFMADEVGQYIGTDTDKLLNLQSLVEEIGSKCKGKVWVICTGQQAIDEIIKVRENEFSRIQARFKTRLSLSSSSVDEVIQKRILKKKPVAENCLTSLYEANDSVLRNLFTFSGAVGDIKGYRNTEDYVADYPFVPYQFTLMSKAFAEIRKHGNSGKHLSGGERSMLSGFQEAAQKIQDRDEFALVPFYYFYDTVHTFLDSSIRNVIERCQRAADKHNDIEQYDVDLLKLLYLIRYVHDDIPANLDNIVILMADNVCTDKIVLKEKVRESLNRLLMQNYIGRTNNTYNFLTDEEQDVQRDIRNTQIDSSSIINRIGGILTSDIYASKKFKYGISDFPFDVKVDNLTIGTSTGGMQLKFMTVAADPDSKTEMNLFNDSRNSAIIVLGESNYYELTETALKIRKYVQSKNIYSLSPSMQKLIKEQRELADGYERTAKEELVKAVIDSTFFVAGDKQTIRKSDAKTMINEALEYLVAHVYSDLSLLDKTVKDDAEIRGILLGDEWFGEEENAMRPNPDATAKIMEYLTMMERQNRVVTMFDIQNRYQAIPYGWREIDIAGVVALLINEQKITVKYSGLFVKADNPKMIDMLRKKSEVGKTVIAIRQSISIQKINQAKALLRDYFDTQDVGQKEDATIAFIIKKFTEYQEHIVALRENYKRNPYYPDKDKVNTAYELTKDILSKKDDNFALIDRLLSREEELFENKEEMVNVEGFFRSQVKIFDEAYTLTEGLRDEKDYFAKNKEAYDALDRIEEITEKQTSFNYSRIHELHSLVAVVNDAHDKLLEKKREDVTNTVEQCRESVREAAKDVAGADTILAEAEHRFDSINAIIIEKTNLALLDGYVTQVSSYKDSVCSRIEALSKSNQNPVTETTKPEKNIKKCQKSAVFNSRLIETQDDIEKYVSEIREKLTSLLDGCDGIQLN